MKERDCANCKHHTEDGCSSWDCEFEKAMTKQEAIKWIIYEKDSIDTEGYCATKENYARIQALDMAIEALSSDAVHIDIYRELYEKYVELKHESAELPKGDLISRQWLLDLYGDYIGDNGDPKYHVPLEVVRQNIIDAPSADAVTIHEDGTLNVKVPNAQRVGRVLVMDTDSHIGGGLFYPDDAVSREDTVTPNSPISIQAVHGEWIPCSERLPSDANEVLACTDGGWVDIAKYNTSREEWHAIGKGKKNITAWMPLPTPYKGGDTE